MSTKQENLTILKKQYPSFYSFLTGSEETDPCSLQVLPTASGHPTLSVNGTLVHSSRDPQREAERLAQAYPKDQSLVLFGFGLGYLAEAIHKKNPDRCIIIVERHKSIIMSALENRDLSVLFLKGQLMFLVGGSGQAIIQSLGVLDAVPVLVKTRALVEQDQDWYDAVETFIQNWKNQKEINEATRKRFARRWTRNLALNAHKLAMTPDINFLKNIAADLPVLIAAGGPSLDSVLAKLPQLAERCIIIAVDTSVRAILRNGIHPDFIVSVDPQYWNSRHLDYCSSARSCLISETAVYPSVLRLPFRQCFFYKSSFSLGAFLENRVGITGSLGAGGSVACAAWDFARFIGARSIWTAGLDLAYPDLKTHFKGALFEAWSHFSSTRIDPSETAMYRMLVSGQNRKATALSGKPLISDRRMLLYASWFERQFNTDPDNAPRSLGSQGLAMEGMTICSIADLLNLKPRRKEIEARLSERLKKIESNFASEAETAVRKKALKEALEELENILLSLINDCKRALREVNDAKSCIHGPEKKSINPMLLEMERINTAIYNNKAKDIASFLFPQIQDLKTKAAASSESPEEEHLDFSELLYEEIIKNTSFVLELLKIYAKENT